MEPLLAVRDLHVHYPTADGVARAVDGVSFDIEAGGVMGLVGESGCGKSSVALAVARLHADSVRVSGSVEFQGLSVLDAPPQRLRTVRGRGIGFIFQDPAAAFNPLYTIGGQVAEAVRLHRPVSRRSARQEAADLLGSVRLPDPGRVAGQYPHELSGGMLQRAALAAALAGGPSLLVADEPTASLDVTVQSEILALVRTLRAERRLAVLWISHDLDVIAGVVERVAVMYAGKVVETGPVRSVFGAPLHPYTRGLLRCRPRLGQSGRLPTIEGTAPPPTRLPDGCRFGGRCGYRAPECGREPALEEHRSGHAAACWKWGELTEGPPA